MALKYAARSQFASPKITTIEVSLPPPVSPANTPYSVYVYIYLLLSQVTSYVRDDRSNSKKFRYELFVEWSDETRYSLYRLYSDFYEFQSELEAMFPVQAGQISQQVGIFVSPW